MHLLKQALDLAKRLQSNEYNVSTLEKVPAYEKVMGKFLQGKFSIDNNENLNILINATFNKFLNEYIW